MDTRIKALPRGNMENPLVGTTTVVPVDVDVNEDRVLWKRDPVKEWRWPLQGFREGGSAEGALWNFLQLCDGGVKDIDQYARKYGVLALRSDGFPHTAPVSDGTDFGEVVADQAKGPDGSWWWSEPVAAWKMYADGLRAVLVFARELRDNAYVDIDRVTKKYGLRIEDFSFYGLPAMHDENHVTPLHARWMSSGPKTLCSLLSQANSAELRRYVFAWFVSDQWISPSGLNPILAWEGGPDSMTLSLGISNIHSTVPVNSLYRVLISQFVSVVTSDPFHRLDVCSVCGQLFIPAVRPGRHMRSFCEYHKIEGERERKRRWARKVAAERKAQQGV